MKYRVMGIPSRIGGGTYMADVVEDQVPYRLVAQVYGDTSRQAKALA